MAINQLINNSGGTDWGEYSPFYEIINVPMPDFENVFYTALEIQGQGYISKALVMDNANIKVTIDGELVYRSAIVGTSTCMGIVEQDQIIQTLNGVPAVTFHQLGLVALHRLSKYPEYDGIGSVIVPKPIFFGKSILIELSRQSSQQQSRTCVVAGGIKL